MFNEFSILTIETILAEKKIIITANQDIDVNSLDDTVITIFERETKSPVMFESEANSKVITATLKEWPIPNSEYIVLIKDLKSVTGDLLASGVKKRVAFDSQIESIAKITTPVMHEKVTELKIEIQEDLVNPTANLINSFYIELSTDNAFINIVAKTSILSRNTITLNEVIDGQYFLRVRVQNETNGTIQYSRWSDTTTFVFGNENENPIIIDPTDPTNTDGPIIDIDEDLEIITSPQNGITPSSILLEFNYPIDETSLGKIVIIRRDVR